MVENYWAHVAGGPERASMTPHLLSDHLTAVANLAARFADDFGAADWGRLAGLLHDLGKFRPGFQDYIRQANGVDAHIEGRVSDRDKTHSAAGALWAEQLLTERFAAKGQMVSRVLQYVIAGHHAGLDNWEGGLACRLSSADARHELDQARAAQPPNDILYPDTDALSFQSLRIAREQGATTGRFALRVRLLFSALVDADFLDTEAFMDAHRHSARGVPPAISVLRDALSAHLATLQARVPDTPVNRLRQQILTQCRGKAACAPGVFTLTVPTGGGKTLSSLAFALEHAVAQGKRRIIYAIPYTSIIEQTADTFREVFATLGDEIVIEHHSNAESSPERETTHSRLACENWDGPLIVTTNVQLFESLFARRTSRCRKLHNICQSVIVLDEAQLLPVEFLQPIVDVLRLLVSDYGVTLVFCTATQPVLTRSASTDPRRGLQRGFDPAAVTEIVDNVSDLYAALERVRIHIPADLNLARTWPDLADELLTHEAVLAIVSRRADARELFTQVRQHDREGCWHLSALMCPQHRSDVLARIKEALSLRRQWLAQGLAAPPVRVVSTQLVEAGVDLDFPVVYRALAGLDSIAQAAGRCNREGRLAAGRGDVHVFVPPTQAPPGLLKAARELCRMLWHDRPAEPLSLQLFECYFQRLYHDADLDAKRICDALRLECDQGERTLAVRFRDASDAFRLIDDKDAATVLVRYASPRAQHPVDKLIDELEHHGPRRELMRQLQRYSVTIYKRQIADLIRQGHITEVASCPGLYAQIPNGAGFYDSEWGVNVDGAPGDPGQLVI